MGDRKGAEIRFPGARRFIVDGWPGDVRDALGDLDGALTEERKSSLNQVGLLTWMAINQGAYFFLFLLFILQEELGFALLSCIWPLIALMAFANYLGMWFWEIEIGDKKYAPPFPGLWKQGAWSPVIQVTSGPVLFFGVFLFGFGRQMMALYLLASAVWLGTAMACYLREALSFVPKQLRLYWQTKCRRRWVEAEDFRLLADSALEIMGKGKAQKPHKITITFPSMTKDGFGPGVVIEDGWLMERPGTTLDIEGPDGTLRIHESIRSCKFAFFPETPSMWRSRVVLEWEQNGTVRRWVGPNAFGNLEEPIRVESPDLCHEALEALLKGKEPKTTKSDESDALTEIHQHIIQDRRSAGYSRGVNLMLEGLFTDSEPCLQQARDAFDDMDEASEDRRAIDIRRSVLGIMNIGKMMDIGRESDATYVWLEVGGIRRVRGDEAGAREAYSQAGQVGDLRLLQVGIEQGVVPDAKILQESALGPAVVATARNLRETGFPEKGLDLLNAVMDPLEDSEIPDVLGNAFRERGLARIASEDVDLAFSDLWDFVSTRWWDRLLEQFPAWTRNRSIWKWGFQALVFLVICGLVIPRVGKLDLMSLQDVEGFLLIEFACVLIGRLLNPWLGGLLGGLGFYIAGLHHDIWAVAIADGILGFGLGWIISHLDVGPIANSIRSSVRDIEPVPVAIREWVEEGLTHLD